MTLKTRRPNPTEPTYYWPPGWKWTLIHPAVLFGGFAIALGILALLK